jgi:Ran GTPase-activating protein (RanGAP) involved in mRNA processing and transport
MADEDGAFHNTQRRKGILLQKKTDEEEEKKKLKEAEENKIIDYNVVFSEKLGPLNFPPQFKIKRPSTVDGTQVKTSDNPLSVLDIEQAEGLPGNLSLDYATTQKYFGDNARLHFFDRYRFLDYQSKITVTNTKKPLEKLYFENEKPSSFESVPFGPIRGETNQMSNTQSVSGLHITTAGSSFRAKFQQSLKDASNTMINNDIMMLEHSAKRSGEDYTLDEQEALFEEELMRKEQDSKDMLPRRTLRPRTAINEPRRVSDLGTGSLIYNQATGSRATFSQGKRPQSALPTSSSSAQPQPGATTNTVQTTSNAGELSRTLSTNAMSVASSHTKPQKPPKPPSALQTLRSIHKQKVEDVAKVQRAIIKAAAETQKRAKEGKKKDKSNKSRFKQSFASSTPDVYSQIILDDLLLKFNIKNQESLENDVNKGRHSSMLFPLKNHGEDDVSVATESTVSTLGLYLRDHYANGEDPSLGMITSPRTKFLASCMSAKLNPRASLVLRKNMSKKLNLQHHGIGDRMAALLAESLKDLPFIEVINIADNMLTDDGMGPIIHAAVKMPGLIELNLSQNEIGPVSSAALHDYLIEEQCPLQTLILNAADVDDFECAGFIDAVKQNKSLREVDLSGNLIGKSENLNTVMPDIITGGEAIADLLRSSECNLTKLHLQWNMIRLDGAIDLASSLAINNTLLYLDLSFNSLSTDGGIVLGMSLLKNRTLQTLILSNNSLDAKASFTICAGIIENRSLKKVVLDGNPIGVQVPLCLFLFFSLFFSYPLSCFLSLFLFLGCVYLPLSHLAVASLIRE